MLKNNQFKSYEEIIALPPEDFITYIYEHFPDTEIDIEKTESIKKAAEKMTGISGALIFFTEIQARIAVKKRNAKWESDDAKGSGDLAKTKKREYEALVDKDKIMDGAINALETQYRAINRVATIWIEAEKEKQRY